MRTFADYRARSYWLEQSSANYVASPELEGMVRADVLVVGGGVTGISTAYHLKKDHPGLRVAVLESDVVGHGASGRNAGLATTAFGLRLELTVRRFGRQRALQAQRYMERAVSAIGELVRTRQLKCEYEYPGFLRVATNPTAVRRIQKEIELAQSLGISGIDWIEAADARALIDSPTYLGAWRQTHAALINPAAFVREMKRAAAGLGVEVYEHTPAISLDIARVIRARTPHGAVEADKLVLATSAYSAQFRQLHSRQCPLHTYMVLTAPLNEEQRASLGWRGRQGIEDARNLAHYYRLTPDGRLLVGGDVHYFYGNQVDIDKHNPSFAGLQWFIAETFPGLHGIKITHRWGGPISATLDGAPAIGYLGTERRVIYSIGCMGHGSALASLNGQTISDMIGERRTEQTDMFFVNRALIPIPPEPLRAPLAHGILGVMRAQDTFDERHGLGRIN